ncbi:MAG: alpha/beta fold hydrolase [Alphaproteobacteria bacterium]|nr:alpha/beta fold hydrolase [Alphaproteobacteria bacterium]
MTKITPTASRKPLSGQSAKQLVLFLHGWGADGPNLIDLADMIAPYLPDAHFIAPNAPYVCEVNPYGFQWFGLMDRTPSKMLDGTRNAADILNRFIDEQLAALGLENSKLALVGFSQGTMTGLHVALRRTPAMAAFVGFSGALIAPELLKDEATAKPPVCLIHGQMDDVVPYASMKNAETALKTVGITAETHTRPGLGHSIDLEGIKTAGGFLQRHLLARP